MEIAQILGWIATMLFTLCYVPQIIRMLRQNSVEGVSFLFLAIPLFGNIIALIYASMIDQNPLILKYILGIAFSLLCLSAYIVVRSRS